MPALTGAIRSETQFSDNFLSPLSDAARRERTVVLALLVYVVLWTAYGVIAKGSQDVHIDMSEQFMLARELALGYSKHPPLTMLIVRLWFGVFPTTDWAYYLLAVPNACVALWIEWRLYAQFLDGEKRVLGLALLTLVPFFNFHALKFNPNTVLMPLWAATTLYGQQPPCFFCARLKRVDCSMPRLQGVLPHWRCMGNIGPWCCCWG